MKFLDWFRLHEGEFIIHAPLKACIRHLERFPEQVSWDAYYKGYAVKNKQQIEPNKFSYMLLFAGFRGIRFGNYLAKLNVELEAIDDNTTHAKCVAQISTNLLIIVPIIIFVGLVFSALILPFVSSYGGNLLQIIFHFFMSLMFIGPVFLFGGLFFLYAGFQSSAELIEFHQKQLLTIETRSI